MAKDFDTNQSSEKEGILCVLVVSELKVGAKDPPVTADDFISGYLVSV